MANSSSAASAISMKLLINTKTHKVLFAEASKDFVDFLFFILSLPVAKVIGLVGKQSMVGSLSNLYESVENLSETYVQPNQTKSILLKPLAATTAYGTVPLLGVEDVPAIAQKKFYRCNDDEYDCEHTHVSNDPLDTCPDCNGSMTYEMIYLATPGDQAEVVSGSGDEGSGFVKGVVTYMVMDDLVVKPMSTISSITILSKFNVKEIGDLEEKVIDFGMDEAVMLLKASMETKNVLTTVFLIKPTN